MGRVGWLAGFARWRAGLAVLFSSQIWAALHGFAMGRPEAGVRPLRGSALELRRAVAGMRINALVPLECLRPPDDCPAGECSSYLGVVTLAAASAYAASRRVRFPRAGYWWSAWDCMVVLSLGASRPGRRAEGRPAGGHGSTESSRRSI